MSSKMTVPDNWWQTPSGQYLLIWEQTQLDEILPNVFGYHALQLGSPQLDALLSNRMPHRWLGLMQQDAFTDTETYAAGYRRQGLFFVDPTALPFQNDSLDLVVLPHTLELSKDPHATLREIARVLRPEGRVVIVGLNPFSLWTLKEWPSRIFKKISFKFKSHPSVNPKSGYALSYWRLLDWLKLLELNVQELRFGIYQPAVNSAKWLKRWDWMNRLGPRWWPICGAVYLVVATKKVHGMRLLGSAWHASSRTKTIAPVASWFRP